jgi:hypothetical protein
MSRGFRSIVVGLAVAAAGVFLVHYSIRPLYWIWLPGAVIAEHLMRSGLAPRYWFWPLSGRAVEVADTLANWAIYSAFAYSARAFIERRRRSEVVAATKTATSDAQQPTGASHR